MTDAERAALPAGTIVFTGGNKFLLFTSPRQGVSQGNTYWFARARRMTKSTGVFERTCRDRNLGTHFEVCGFQEVITA